MEKVPPKEVDEVFYVFRISGGLLVDASKCVRRDFRMIMCVRGE